MARLWIHFLSLNPRRPLFLNSISVHKRKNLKKLSIPVPWITTPAAEATHFLKETPG